MSNQRSAEKAITKVARLGVRLLANDIDSLRACNEPRQGLSHNRLITDGHIGIGRRVMAWAADNTVIHDSLQVASSPRRSSPQDILADKNHHLILNKEMEKKVRDLTKGRRGEVEETGDFVPAGTVSAKWYNSGRHRFIRADEYTTLDALAAELTSLGYGEYLIRLCTESTMPVDIMSHRKTQQKGLRRNKPSDVVSLPANWVSVVGIGEGNGLPQDTLFNNRAEIAFLALSSLRAVGEDIGTATTVAVEQASKPDATLHATIVYLNEREDVYI